MQLSIQIAVQAPDTHKYFFCKLSCTIYLFLQFGYYLNRSPEQYHLIRQYSRHWHDICHLAQQGTVSTVQI
jgi:hypothetical protein